ncbi:hypothetical protein ACF0H5_008951 [Mactra antiquata]
MGCTSSLRLSKISVSRGRQNFGGNSSELKTTIITTDPKVTIHTPDDIAALVKESWRRLSGDIPGNGLQVFLRIFETCPRTKKLFQVDNVRLSELARNVTIQRHGKRFMLAIGAAVENIDGIDEKDSELSKLLIVLGRQHKHYEGFKPEYFEVFYDALMWQWERYLGNEFTPEVADTWSRVFVYFMEKLKEGYRQP